MRKKNHVLRDRLKYEINGERKMILLRGVQGSGKSTFVKENNLEEFTMSMDLLRGHILPLAHNGDYYLTSQVENRFIYEKFMELLEFRLRLGGNVVIDNLNLTKSNIKNYEKLAYRYGYEITVINFEVDEEVLHERNEARRFTKKFGGDNLAKNIQVFKDSTKEVEDNYRVISSKDKKSIAKLLKDEYLSLDNYREVKVIGDIHGCYDELLLSLGLEDNNIEEDVFYVFLGDYIDRGTQNAKVLEFMIENCDKENVVLLEGNHELYIRAYVNKFDLGYGEEFNKNTKVDIEKRDLSREDLKKFVNSLKTYFTFSYNNKRYLCTHGGINETDLFKTTHFERIFGHGGYLYDIDIKYTGDVIQFHGHRNKFKFNNKAGNIYNLEDSVERGGTLVVATIDGMDGVTITNTRKEGTLPEDNNLIKAHVLQLESENNARVQETTIGLGSEESKKLYNLKLVRGYDLDENNFGKKIIRGLFFDSDYKVILRGYDKFYNVGQVSTLEELIEGFEYPVISYKKENGFLGLLSYDTDINDFLFGTKNMVIDSNKTSDRTSFAEEFRRLFYKVFNEEQQNLLREFMLFNDVTLSFEVISFKDKHITKEEEEKIVLLDAIENKYEFKARRYKNIVKLEKDLNKISKIEEGFHIKERAMTFNNKAKLRKFIKSDLNNMNTQHEGFILTDSNVMVKYKSIKYFYFKEVRNTIKRVIRREERSSKVYVYLNNFLDWHDIEEDSKAYKYIKSTFPTIQDIVENKDKFMFDNLIGGRELDVPKIIDYVNEELEKEKE